MVFCDEHYFRAGRSSERPQQATLGRSIFLYLLCTSAPGRGLGELLFGHGKDNEFIPVKQNMPAGVGHRGHRGSRGLWASSLSLWRSCLFCSEEQTLFLSPFPGQGGMGLQFVLDSQVLHACSVNERKAKLVHFFGV